MFTFFSPQTYHFSKYEYMAHLDMHKILKDCHFILGFFFQDQSDTGM